MEKFNYIIIFIIITLLLGSELHAQWINDGPYDAGVTSFTISSNGAGSSNIFAATGNGVYISTDNGANWTTANNGLPVYGSVSALAASGSKVYAGFNDNNGPDQSESGVYATTDNGSNWTPVSGLPMGSNVQTISASGTRIFAAIDSEVYYSSDNGTTWTFSRNGFTYFDYPNNIEISDSAVFALTSYGKIYKSIDNGMNWTAADSGLPSTIDIQSFVVSDTAIYAADYNDYIYISTDNGISWSNVVFLGAVYPNYIYALAISGTKILAGTELGGIYSSSDGGTNWIQVDSGIPENTNVYCFAFSGKSIFAGTDDGVYLSSDQANSWSSTVTGMTDFNVEAFSVSGENIFAATGTDVFHSSDDGKTWSGINNGLPNYPYDAVAVSGNNVFAGSYFKGLFKSTNNGTSWYAASGDLPFVRVNCLAAIDSIIFVGTNTNGIYVSTNNGVNWTTADSGLPASYTEVDQFAVSGNNAFALAYGGSLYRSTDQGKSWVVINDSVSQGINGNSVGGIAVSGTSIYALSGSGVIVSKDNGSSWASINNGLPLNPNIYAIAASDKYIFAATDSGLYSLTSNNTNWAHVNGVGIPVYLNVPGIKSINALAVSGSNVYASGGLSILNGVWQRPLSQIVTSIESKPKGLPSTYSLSQNYPNPFNPSTTINYSIAKSGLVTLRVYNILGELVRTLVNKYENGGEHKIVFDADKYGLASGIYFYRLKENNFIKTDKMVYLK